MAGKPLNRPSWAVLAGAALLTGISGFGAANLLSKKETPAAATGVTAPKTELTLPDAYISQAGISIQDVSSGNLAAEISAPGTVVASPNGEAVVVARAAGTVIHMDKRLGDPVSAGQVIATVDSLDAATMASDRSVAATRAIQAHAVLAREKKLFDQGVTARQDFEAAQAAADVADAEARRATAIAQAARVSSNGRSVAIVSPINGRITAQAATLGAYVTSDTELFRVANTEGVQIEAAVPAADARNVNVGDMVSISTGGSVTIEGKVRSVTPTARATTGAATVVVTPGSNSAMLVPGAGVQVQLHAASATTTGMIIPEEAVQVIDGKDSVFVKTAKGFKVQPVTVARRTGGRAEIRAGLASGQRIATRNAFLLKAELTKSVED